jgi:truncated hemoglobin YjbI
MGERHIQQYGAQIEYFGLFKHALSLALHEFYKEKYTTELESAWEDVFDDVSSIMKKMMSKVNTNDIQRKMHDMSGYDSSLLKEIGGEKVVTQVHQKFYDVIFEHNWLGQFFYGKSKKALVRKQTEFMVAAFNGPNHYQGDTPAFIHMHMFITGEMIILREKILRTAIIEQGLSDSVANRWLMVDRSFKDAIVKESIDDCVMKCMGQIPITAKKPTPKT